MTPEEQVVAALALVVEDPKQPKLRPRLRAILDPPDDPPPPPPVYPEAAWRVGGDNSVWNTKVDHSLVDPGSETMIASLARHGALGESTTDSSRRKWGPTLWFGDSTHDLYTINTTHGDEDSRKQDGRSVRCPAGARPATESDGVMWVIDEEGGWANHLQRAEPNHETKTLHAWKSFRFPLDGNGLPDLPTGAPTGIQPIRPEELKAGYVNHAMSFGTGTLTSGPVGPYEDSGTKGKPLPPNDVPDHLHMGSRMFLDYTDEEIEALDIPIYRKAVVYGFAHYGAVVGLNGGSNFALKMQNPLDGCDYSGLPSTMDFGPGVDWRGRLRVAPPFPRP